MDAQECFTENVILTLKARLHLAKGKRFFWIATAATSAQISQVACAGDEEAFLTLVPQLKAGEVVISNGLSEEPGIGLDKDQLAVYLCGQGADLWLIDEEVNSVHKLSDGLKPSLQEFSLAEAVSVLKPGGGFSQLIASYEPRKAQIELLKLFVKGFSQDAIVVAEAGTGVGKSFAYLIPSLLWAYHNKERIVISTATINLQHQLMEKDIPLSLKALGIDLRVVLVKGRRNYLCSERLLEELKDPSQTDRAFSQLKRIAEWAQTTSTGDVSELEFVPDDSLWSRISSDADSCPAAKCLRKENCFLARERKRASGASLLIVNHHLLFADLALRLNSLGFESYAVLPPFHRLVFDEAHTIDKSAVQYFSQTFNRPLLFKLLARLYRKRRNDTQGLVVSLQGLSSATIDFQLFPLYIQEIQHSSEVLEKEIISKMDFSLLRLAGEEGRIFVESLFPSIALLQKPLSSLIALCEKLAECYEQEPEPPYEIHELKSTVQRLSSILKILERTEIFWQEDHSVFWFEKVHDDQTAPYVQWVIAPLGVGQLIDKAVFRPYRTVLLTSATLTIQGQFSFWAPRVGLDLVEKDRLLQGLFPSPYDYKNKVLLAIPMDFPSPKEVDYQKELQDYLPELLRASGGRALVLFTSYQSMQQAWQTVSLALRGDSINVYKQGDEERSKLLVRFKQEVSSVLFATDSFWEGVDTQGDALQMVVICRIPFRMPSNPLVAARMEELEKQGKDSFIHYSLPEAVTRFQQGFGRLIRHNEDSGCIVVLDTRLFQKNYGQFFLKALPETKRYVGSRKQVLKQVACFLDSSRGSVTC